MWHLFDSAEGGFTPASGQLSHLQSITLLPTEAVLGNVSWQGCVPSAGWKEGFNAGCQGYAPRKCTATHIILVGGRVCLQLCNSMTVPAWPVWCHPSVGPSDIEFRITKTNRIIISEPSLHLTPVLVVRFVSFKLVDVRLSSDCGKP